MRPNINLLSPEQIEQTVEDALQVLSKVGMEVENDEATTLLKEASVKVVDGRAFIEEKTVRAALKTAPATIKIAGRDGSSELTLGGDNVHFDPGSAALWILDPETRKERAPIVDDCAHLAWVTEACKNIELQATGLIPTDVPDIIADRFRLFVALLNCRKPVVTGTFRTDGFAVMHKMLTAVRGSEQALRELPLAIFDCAPTPPLKWSDLTCQALVDCARTGIPAELVSMPMAGATSPITLRDVVVQHCAECMCGVVIHQLAGSGAPIIWGGSPSVMDMRTGNTPMGAIETMMVDCCDAAVGKHLGLPTHAYMSLSDSKSPDWQAGVETGIGAALAALAGINVISGPGMLDFESCQSLEKLLLDNESCGMALRLARGMGERSPNSSELFEALVSEGHMLGHSHTRTRYRQELYMPGRGIDRGPYGDWEKAGQQSAFKRATADVAKLISKGNPAPLDDDNLRNELKDLVEAEGRRLEVNLPILL